MHCRYDGCRTFRAVELSENLKLLEVQVESQKSHIQGKRKALVDLLNVYERHGREFAVCHTSDHNRTSCKNFCKLKDRHQE